MNHEMISGRRPAAALFLLGALAGGFAHAVGEHATQFMIATLDRPHQSEIAYRGGDGDSGCCGGDSSFRAGDIPKHRRG